jgi:transposase
LPSPNLLRPERTVRECGDVSEGPFFGNAGFSSFIDPSIAIALASGVWYWLGMRTPENGKEAERRRLQAVALAKEGLSAAEIGRRLSVDPRTVRRWKAAFRESGKVGLKTKRAPGAPCRMTVRQRQDLTRRLIRGALSEDFTSDLWTCRRVAQLIEQRYGVTYHVAHLPKLLKSLGFTVQKPERQARERDANAIGHWVQQVWPALKKKRRGRTDH